MQGYEALRERAAWMEVPRGRIVARGEDRARLLHAMSTNHVQGLTPGQGVYAYFLNAQGRILAAANLLCRDEDILIDTDAASAAGLFAHIDRYIIADDVSLEDQTAAWVTIAVEGPGADAIVKAGVRQEYASHAPYRGGLAARLSFTGQPGLWLSVPVEEKPQMVADLEAAGVAAADEEAAQAARIENGKPAYGADFTDANLPQETREAHALHFNKGCYLGQEIVERVRSRGHVNRLLTRLEMEGPPPAAGEKVLSGGKEAGQVTSAAVSPGTGKTVLLAYVRAEYLRPGVELTAGGRPITVAGV